MTCTKRHAGRKRWGLRCTLLWLGAVGALLPALAAGSWTLGGLQPARSIAAADGALAVVRNPATLAAADRWELLYVRGVRGAARGEQGLWFAAKGAGGALEYFTISPPVPTLLPASVSVRRWTWGAGSHLGRGVYWGASRVGFASDDPQWDALSYWNLGLLVRRRWVSLGLVVRRLNRPRLYARRLERLYEVGIAWRPHTDRLTFSVDLWREESQAWKSAWKAGNRRVSLTAEPIDGVELRADALGQRRWELSLTLRWGWLGLGGQQQIASGATGSAIAWVELRPDYTEPPIRRHRLVLETGPTEWHQTVAAARGDRRVVGFLLRLRGERLSLAEWESIRQGIQRERRQGRRVIAFVERTGTGGYWTASAADEIVLDPLGTVELVGLHSRRLYYRELLDRLGLRPIVVREGPYKSAPESWLFTGPSRYTAHNRDALFSELFERISRQIVQARPALKGQLGTLYREGYFLGEEAQQADLVDDVATREDLHQRLKDRVPRGEVLSLREYRSRPLRSRAWRVPGPRIARVPIRGTLVDRADWRMELLGEFCSAERVAQALETARKDDSIQAVVLEIDSGGGLVSAAETIWRAVSRTAQEKPVVAVIQGVGASGAYYAATGADRIVAGATSLTGSIGVFSGIVALDELLEKWGVRAATTHYGYPEEPGVWVTGPTERGQRRLEKQVGRLYAHFVRSVAERRGLPVPWVQTAAGGQVWTGRQARARGLVDTLGDLEDGLRLARQLAGLPSDAPAVRLPRSGWRTRAVRWLEQLQGTNEERFRLDRDAWIAFDRPMAYEPLGEWKTP